jgi:hypothetical protein
MVLPYQLAYAFAFLSGPMLSLFSAVYTFMRSQPEACAQVVPEDVKHELRLFCCLGIYLEADLTRTWHGTLCASDASQVFGFGLTAADLGPSRVRDLALHAARSDCHVRPAGDEGIEVARLGKSYRLPVPQSAFRTFLSKKARFSAHSGALEAAGVTLMIRWITRSAARHGFRFCCFVDAQSVLGAAAKGRSSAPTIRSEVARLGALCTAANLLVRYVYVPSESNPADAPSRCLAL